MAGLGPDRIIVGAYQDDAGESDAGSAYLYDTNGVLLVTITNPAPAFGDYFGYSVAGLGADRIIVGAYRDDAGASDAGSAYLYDTNGVLLTTIANPAPAATDRFGWSVAGLGADKIIVGAFMDDAGADDAGSAYLYDTNGVLQATIANPAPAATDYFGYSVAGLGADKLIVGGPYDDNGVYNAGSAYLFNSRPTPYSVTNRVTLACAQALTNEAGAVAEAALLVGSSTLVVLFDFYLQEMNGEIQVCWQTASELNTLGFDLFRWDEAAGQWIKVNSAMVAAQGWPQGGLGASYSVADAGASADGTCRYKLVEYETTGDLREYGPFERSIGGPRLSSFFATPAGVVLQWLSREAEVYDVLKADGLRGAFVPAAQGLPATPPINAWTDRTESAGAAFYRIEAR